MTANKSVTANYQIQSYTLSYTAGVGGSIPARWESVGSSGFSAGSIEYSTLAISSDGTPYVAYRDDASSGKATVMRFNGTNWVAVGTPGFSADMADFTSIAMGSNDTPYVVYRDVGNGTRATVKKFDGTNWITVGNAGFSAGDVIGISLAISSDGTPYAAYQDYGNGGTATVMKFNGTSWVAVGTAGFSAGPAYFPSMAISSEGTPYIAYADGSNNYKLTVRKFNGTSWEAVGGDAFTLDRIEHSSIVIGADGTPYVAFQDFANSGNASVMKFNGTSWEFVGTAGFSTDEAQYISLVVGSDEMLYLAYRDNASGSKSTVQKFNGTSWQTVGQAGFSAGVSTYTSLALSGGGTPYVAYRDNGFNSGATVMRYIEPSSQTVIAGNDGSSAEATADPGYRFVQWSDASTTNPRTDLDIFSNLSVTAQFVRTFTLSYTPGTGGTITGTSPQTVDSLASGSQVTAVPNSGYRFVDWSDGLTTASRTDVNVISDTSVTANFVAVYALAVDSTNGSVQISPLQALYDNNTVVTLTGSADAGYHFLGWAGNGIFSGDNPFTLTMVHDTSVAAIIYKIFSLTYTSGAGGSLSGDSTQSVDSTYNGTEVTAVPDEGYHFVQWSDEVTSASRTALSVTSDLSVTAQFAINTYTLSVTSPNGTVTRNPELVTYNHGIAVTLTATPSAGYAFTGWTGDTVTPANPITLAMTANKSVTANYQIQSYTLTYTAGTGGQVVTEWDTVGSRGFSAGNADFTSLAIASDGAPYVAYRDDANGLKASVMKFEGTDWVAVGSAGFSAGVAEYTSLAFNADTPYVAYRDGSNGSKVSVMKFDGTNWVTVGSVGFSAGQAYYTSLAFDGSTPYVAYQDVGNGDKATVMKFNGTSWIAVGSAGFSAGSVGFTSLAFDGGTPYVAYNDGANGGKATVMKFNGTNWVAVGTAGFSSGTAYYTSLAFDGGTPYVAYMMDIANGLKASVMRFNGTVWEAVGSAGFSAGAAHYTSLVFNGSTPYVAYRDGANGTKATVMKFNGTSWEAVGAAGFSAADVNYTSLAIASDGTSYVAYQDVANGSKATVMQFTEASPQSVVAGNDGTTVEAVASAGYRFKQWSDGSTTNPRTDLSVSSNLSITAQFIRTYSLAYSAGTGGTITGTVSQTVDSLASGSQVTAVATSGYEFDTWSDGVTTASRTDQNIVSNISVTANFRLRSYTLTVDSTNGSVAITPQQTTYLHGSTVTLIATPAAGYAFTGWIGDTTATASTITLTIRNNTSVRAVFLKLYTLTYASGLGGSIASRWETVGAALFPLGGTSESSEISMAFSGSTPYIAYHDGNLGEKATVRKFNSASNSWEVVGTAGFTSTDARDISIAFDGTTPYVAYRSMGTDKRAMVMKFDGSNWVTVGGDGLSAGFAGYISLAISSDGIPYVAYQDGDQFSYKATVKRFNSTSNSWIVVGTEMFSAGKADFINLAFNGTTPYIAYLDEANNEKATVKTFDGTNWVTVGTEGFTTGGSYDNSLAFLGSTLYLAYRDNNDGSKAKLMKFNGTTWEAVGPAASLSGAFVVSLAFGGTTPYVTYLQYTVMTGDFDAVLRPTVVKFNGTTWETVGIATDYTGGFHAHSIAIGPDGTPYLAYRDSTNGNRVTVGRFVGGSTQTVVEGANGAPVTATPHSGYRFVQWSDGSKDNPRTETNVSKDTSAAAQFELITYTLTATSVNGTVTKDPEKDKYLPGDTVKITVDPAEGYRFLRWIGDTTKAERSFRLVMNKDWSVNAEFVRQYTLTYEAGEGGFIRNGWDSIEVGGFSTYDMDIAFRGDDTLFVAFADLDNPPPQPEPDPNFPAPTTDLSGKASVMKFNGSAWEPVGSPGFSAGEVGNLNLVFSHEIPYVAYRDGVAGNKLTVMKFDGTSWIPVGSPGFTAEAAYDISLAMGIDGHPYVAYDVLNSGMKVVKYDGENWTHLETTGLSGNPNIISLAISPAGAPFVAYRDIPDGDKVAVMSYDGQRWNRVGLNKPSTGAAYPGPLAFAADGTPFIGFKDWVNDGKATVAKLDGDYWLEVGSGGISAGSAGLPTVGVRHDGVLFASYTDQALGNKATVMRFRGSSWEPAGVAGLSEGWVNAMDFALDKLGAPHALIIGAANPNPILLKYHDSLPQHVAEGEDAASVEAGARPGYAFVRWSDGVTDNPRTDRQVSSNVSVRALFELELKQAQVQQVGEPGFSEGPVSYPALAISSKGTPYIAYRDAADGNKITAKVLADGSWNTVGTAGFSSGSATYTSLAVSNGDTIFAAYQDSAQGYKGIVKRFPGTAWEDVGTGGFSPDTATYTSLAIGKNGTPYVAYADNAQSSRVTVRRYDGTTWQDVGTAGFSAGAASHTSLAMSNADTLLIAYLDANNGNKATVRKFTGSAWEVVGTEGFSTGISGRLSFALDSAGRPFIAYADANQGNKATVMSYNGATWDTVGTAGFTSGPADNPALAVRKQDGTPFIAYLDAQNGDKATILRYDPTDGWVTVQSGGQSTRTTSGLAARTSNERDVVPTKTTGVARVHAATSYDIFISFSDDGKPYVAYRDVENGGKATVVKLDAPAVTYALAVTAENGIVNWSPQKASYKGGEAVVLTATPTEGYIFSGWWGDTTATANPITLTMTRNRTIAAIFAEKADVVVVGQVADVPDDEGRRVTVSWKSKELEPNIPSIATYSVWRQDSTAWTQVGGMTATGDSIYALEVATRADSSKFTGVTWTFFKVLAMSPQNTIAYVSAVDSGYSLDNIAPTIPARPLAQVSGDSVVLRWPTSGGDVKFYNVYRDTVANFDLAGRTPIATVVDSTFADSGAVSGRLKFYRLTALDAAGNESNPTDAVSSSTTGAGEDELIPKVFTLQQNFPNPFNPTTSIRFGVPSRGIVRIAVYNILGQQITVLSDALFESGYHVAHFDAGRLSSGTYIYRMEVFDEHRMGMVYSRTLKMVVLK